MLKKSICSLLLLPLLVENLFGQNFSLNDIYVIDQNCSLYVDSLGKKPLVLLNKEKHMIQWKANQNLSSQMIRVTVLGQNLDTLYLDKWINQTSLRKSPTNFSRSVIDNNYTDIFMNRVLLGDPSISNLSEDESKREFLRSVYGGISILQELMPETQDKAQLVLYRTIYLAYIITRFPEQMKQSTGLQDMMKTIRGNLEFLEESPPTTTNEKIGWNELKYANIYYRGLVKYELRDWEGAIEDFKLVHRYLKSPESISVLQSTSPIFFSGIEGRCTNNFIEWEICKFKPMEQLGICYYVLGQFSYSIQSANYCIADCMGINDVKMRMNYLIGLDYQEMGDTAKAIKYYGIAGELGHEDAYNKIQSLR